MNFLNKGLMLMMVVSLSAFAGDKGGNGGDPFIVRSTPYPQMNQIFTALDLAENQVALSSYPDSFKDAFIKELKELRKDELKFQLLPSMVVVNDDYNGEALPLDVNQFVVQGGMTRAETGAHIYFSERVLQYDNVKLAKLLIHEISHHVLPSSLKKNEKFINLLSNSIAAQKQDENVEKAFLIGAYFYKNRILRDEFLESTKYVDSIFRILYGRNPWIKNEKHRVLVDNYRKEINKKLVEVLPENLAKTPVKVFIKIVDNIYTDTLYRLLDFNWINSGVYIPLYKLLKDLKAYDSSFAHCKLPQGFFSKPCPEDQLFLMDEIFIFPELNVQQKPII